MAHEQTENFTFFDFKRDSFDGGEVTVVLGEVLYFEDGRHELLLGCGCYSVYEQRWKWLYIMLNNCTPSLSPATCDIATLLHLKTSRPASNS